MKKILLTAGFIAGVIITNAQSELTFKPFKVDISAGYASSAEGSGNHGGFLFSVEPKYAVSDQFTLGVKAEIALAITGDENTGTVKGTGSYLATGDYYFNTNALRPFVGAGVGIFTHASADIGSSEEIKGTTKFGYAPRLGIEVAHFRAAFEYNFAGKAAGVSKNYIGIKMGVLIGGGRIN